MIPKNIQNRPLPYGNNPAQLYQLLDEASQTIRLLYVHPPSGDASEIECTIYTAKLEDNPQFTALSYAWGDTEITQTVIVNGLLPPAGDREPRHCASTHPSDQCQTHP